MSNSPATAAAAAPSNMPAITIGTGVICIALGIGLAAGAASNGSKIATALIPAYVGAIFVALGALSRTPTLRKHLMHVAAGLSLLLVLAGLGMGLPKIVRYHTGNWPVDLPARPLAWWGQVALAAVMAAFLTLAVRSFIAARRWRNTGV